VTLFRLALAPTMLASAAWHMRTLFLSILALAILTDAIDGRLARTHGSPSERGARLDSIADLPMIFVGPIGVWLAWPEVVAREAVCFGIVLASIIALISSLLDVPRTDVSSVLRVMTAKYGRTMRPLGPTSTRDSRE
jgi:cardiolipin synthase (CMP-forming)